MSTNPREGLPPYTEESRDHHHANCQAQESKHLPGISWATELPMFGSSEAEPTQGQQWSEFAAQG